VGKTKSAPAFPQFSMRIRSTGLVSIGRLYTLF
jgi:hypothetical protein